MIKSKLYQHKLVEISFDQSKLNNFAEDRSISSILLQNEISEDVGKLREELLAEVHKIIVSDKYLTPHQRNVLKMRLSGQTQNEIAQQLGITQSAVHKALFGNIDYRNEKKRYGGIIKKIKKICKIDPQIQRILQEIENIKKQDLDQPDFFY